MITLDTSQVVATLKTGIKGGLGIIPTMHLSSLALVLFVLVFLY